MRVYKDDILYVEYFWSGRKRFFYKDEECYKNENGYYEYKKDDESLEIDVKGNMLTGVKCTIKEEEIVLIKSAQWYEYLLCFAFLALIIYGDNILVSSVVASMLSIVNFIIIRSIKNIFLKILVSIAVAALAFGLIVVLLLLLHTIQGGME